MRSPHDRFLNTSTGVTIPTTTPDAPSVLIPLGVLIVLGSLGFAIVGDVIAKPRWARFALETKLVLIGTVLLITVGAVGTAGLEWSNPGTLGPMQPTDKVVNALFHSVSLRSAGFDSIHVGSVLDESLLLGDRVAIMTAGPAATIKKVLAVPLARPREVGNDFLRLRREIKAAIEDEVMKSMRQVDDANSSGS